MIHKVNNSYYRETYIFPIWKYEQFEQNDIYWSMRQNTGHNILVMQTWISVTYGAISSQTYFHIRISQVLGDAFPFFVYSN